jgi:hypothetical protein
MGAKLHQLQPGHVRHGDVYKHKIGFKGFDCQISLHAVFCFPCNLNAIDFPFYEGM